MQVVTLGNFDGVHRGHQAIVAHAAALAGPSGTVTAVVFEPLPATVLQPRDAPPRLTVEPRRSELLRQAGCTSVLTLDPSSGVLGQAPEEFVRDFRARVPFDAIVEGADFRFGSKRAGTVETLREIGGRLGFRTDIAPEFETPISDGHVVAPRSTLIRWLLQMGRAQDAERLLGRAHEITGRVVAGERRGRELGFPTANIQAPGQQLPADGVYAGVAHTPRGVFRAAISVGTKPTFDGAQCACEAHLLAFPGATDEYGWEIRVEFTRWLREQWRFPSAAALIQQIHLDVAQCA